MTEIIRNDWVWKCLLILVPLILIATVTVLWKLLNQKIATLKFKNFELDFTDYQEIKKHGESDSIEKFRTLLLKQLLFTQEFTNRFQPLISAFVAVCKEHDETHNIKLSENQTYPSLKYVTEALARFRDMQRNSYFNYVINWDCPVYDKVDNGYRQQYIENIGKQDRSTFTPNLLRDCTSPLPSIDIKDYPILARYSDTKLTIQKLLVNLTEILVNSNKDENLEELEPELSGKANIINHLENQIDELNEYIVKQNEQSQILELRFNYSMDIANNMYESLLYWNERSSSILQSQTIAILSTIYKNLSTWLIRNDLPLSQVKLDQYLDIHSENLVAKLNEDIIKQIENFDQSLWIETLKRIKESDIDIGHYFRENIKQWIIGVQQIRFGTNVFLGVKDYDE